MRRKFVVFLGLALVGLAIFGASGSNAADSKKFIAFSNKGLDYYFWTVCQVGTQKESEKRGWTFEASDAKLDSARQFDQFVNFINKKPDAIFADPNDSEGLIAAANQAVAAGIPVAIIDTPLTGGDISITVAFDNYDAGVLAGEALVKALKAKYGEEKGTIVYAIGAMSSEAWRLRREGTDAVMAKYPNITMYEDPADGEIGKTQDFVLNRLSSGEKIDALHTPSDNPGMGLVSALRMENKWFKRGDPNHVIIVTIDGEPIANKFIEEGYYDYSIAQDGFSYSAIAVEMLEKYTFEGKKVPLGPYENKKFYWEKCEIIDSAAGPYCKVPAYEINPDNAADPRHWGIVAEKELNLPYDMSATGL
jgi:ABC-type sugar transport system substrate-binding protein